MGFSSLIWFGVLVPLFQGLSVRESGLNLRHSDHRLNIVNSSNRSTAVHADRVNITSARAEAVRSAIRHVWTGYRNSKAGAVLADEVMPLTGEPGHYWGGVGMQLWEILDTLWLADEHEAFADAERLAQKSLDTFDTPHSDRTSTFELIIRALGGMLSAHALSGKSVFLERAQELGDRLLRAFPGHRVRVDASGDDPYPAAYIDVHHPENVQLTAHWLDPHVSLADVGTNQMEFTELSAASGNSTFEEAANSVMSRLGNLSEQFNKPLLTPLIETRQSPLQMRSTAALPVSVSAMADSYFEYLLKRYLQSGGEDLRALKRWKSAMEAMRQGLLCESGGLTFIAMDGTQQGEKFTPNCWKGVDHISCFVGGMLALAAHEVPQHLAEEWWLPTGKELARTCYEMYRQSPSGLAGETAIISPNGKIEFQKRGFRLRPETVDSLFFLHRVTGDPMYQEWSWKIFEAIDTHTRARYGYAAATDVTQLPVPLRDSQETFLAAETLKYALLTQLPEDVLPLSQYVFSTEAHPFPRKQR